MLPQNAITTPARRLRSARDRQPATRRLERRVNSDCYGRPTMTPIAPVTEEHGYPRSGVLAGCTHPRVAKRHEGGSK